MFSRDEFISMARMGEASGKLPDSESRILHNLFRLNTLSAQDIMTPRTVIVSLPEDSSLDSAWETVTQHPFSRIPVYRDDKDQITGFVLRADILIAHAQGQGSEPLSTIRREIASVRDSLSLNALFDVLLQKRQHMSIVLDEYGGTKGLVTQEDLIETLIGIEIVDETDAVTDMRALARKRWQERANAMGMRPSDKG